MGNACCRGGEEGAKRGALDDGGEDRNDADNPSFGHSNGAYDAHASQREGIIVLHQTHRPSSKASRPGASLSVPEGEEEDDSGGSRPIRAKRSSIAAGIIDADELADPSYEPPSHDKSDETTAFLLHAMRDNFIFDCMCDETKSRFVQAMMSQEYSKGEWVVRQGDVGDYFYIVEEGEVAFHVEKEKKNGEEGGQDGAGLSPQVGTGTRGATFGELALLYNTPRAASVRALTRLVVYRIGQRDFRSLLASRSARDRSNLLSLVKRARAFRDLDDARVGRLVDAFTIVSFAAGERIVNKGDAGNVLYIVRSGQARIEDIGHGSSRFRDQLLNEGDCFGERALLTGETRAANVTAETECTLLAMTKGEFEGILGPLEQVVTRSSRAKYLRSVPVFEYLEPDEIDRCVGRLREERFAKGDAIPTRGKLYMIQEGHVLTTLRDKPGRDGEGMRGGAMTAGPTLVRFGGGDYFGDLWGSYKEDGGAPGKCVLADRIMEETASAESDVTCLTLLTSDIQGVIGDLGRMPRVEERPPADESGDGEAAPPGPRKRSRMTVLKSLQAKGKSSDFIKARKSSSSSWGELSCVEDLKRHRILGMGTFGKVWLVTPKSNNKVNPTPYALKMVSKRQLLQQKLVPTVLREKNVMESIDHPFLLHMVSSFQDENYLYFVLDLILGGELFDLIYSSDGKKAKGNDNPLWRTSPFYRSFGAKMERRIKGLGGIGVRRAAFYSASVIDAFGYLHNRRIVYRDLKPENIMLNDRGYCIVVDLGFAKVVLDKTYTLCGTLEYLAPEVITSKGHNHMADYWSFACLLYELVVGRTPFYEEGLEQLPMLKKIVRADYSFPNSIENPGPGGDGVRSALVQWKDLVSRLLKPKPVERLGNLQNGIEDILDHGWFADHIDFNKFREQEMPAPWVPTIVDPLDTSHFADKFRQQEKPEVFKHKLSSKDQELFRGF